jgi:ribose 5-phosphate isomerase RpiB
MSNKILVGSDELGMGIKNSIKEHLVNNGFEVIDTGMHISLIITFLALQKYFIKGLFAGVLKL